MMSYVSNRRGREKIAKDGIQELKTSLQLPMHFSRYKEGSHHARMMPAKTTRIANAYYSYEVEIYRDTKINTYIFQP